jgi:ABC-type Zn uptake system ZnuABC Zn-binding protein ZnuA
VITTTTVLADFVRQVGGERMTVDALVPRGGEVHTFDPRPSDARRVAAADLVVTNGLGLDAWLAQLAAEAGAGGVPQVALGENLEGVGYLAPSQPGDEGSSPPGEGVNPHLWMNVEYARRYVGRIVEALSAANPDGAATYRANGGRYDAALGELDSWVRQRIGTIPQAQRRVVSLHDAFPYFAAAYGIEIVGVVVESPGQDPSAAEVAALIDVIRASHVRAMWSEVQFSPELAERIAHEGGATVVSDLYTDSLGDPPVDTYVGMIRWDVDRIVEALR